MNPPGQRDPASYSAREMADPSIDSVMLRQIAAVRPDLWPQIQSHPNCDQELAGYIRQNTPPAGPQPPTATGAQQPFGSQTGGQRPPGRPGPQPQGGQPYPGQPHPGQPHPGGQYPGHPEVGSQTSQGAQQIASGAKQLAGGAKDYFNKTVAPAAVSAAQNVSERSGQAPGSPVHWTIWFRFALPVITLIAIISLFMPIVSASYRGYSMSVNYFSEEAGGEGAILLVLFLTIIGFSVASLVTGKKWAIITTGVLGVLAGLIAMINGFGSASAASSQTYGSAGAGAILLGITGIGMMATAIITFLPQQRLTPPPPPPGPPYPPQQYPPQGQPPHQPPPPPRFPQQP